MQGIFSKDNRKARHAVYLTAVVAALITYLLYMPALNHDFLGWDDKKYVSANFFIRSFDAVFFKHAFFGFHASNWHPLTWISHALDYSMWELVPRGHHLTSVLLHTMNTVLVVLLTACLISRPGKTSSAGQKNASFPSEKRVLIVSGITGLLFGIHPIHMESVAWVSERKDLLCAFFYLLSVLSYSLSSRKTSGRENPDRQQFSLPDRFYWFSLIFFVFALMSKPMAVTLPLALLLLDWYPLRTFHHVRPSRVILEKVPFFLLSIGSAVITVLAQRSGQAIAPLTLIPFPARILVALRSLIEYLLKMLYPLHLSPFYPHAGISESVTLFSSSRYLIAFLVVAGITIASVLLVKKQRLWSVVWCHYCITLLPVLGIIQVGNQAMADRYTYLPSIGPFMLVGLGAAWLAERKGTHRSLKNMLLFVAMIAFMGTLSVITVTHHRVWQNTESLWSRVISLYPGMSSLPYNNRGVYYRETGRPEKAVRDFTTGLTIDPDNILLLFNRARAFTQIKQFDRALVDTERAMKLSPGNWKAYSVRARVYSRMEQNEKALADYDRLIQLNPDIAEEYNNRGNIHVRLGHFKEAVEDYTRAIALSHDPAPEYYRNLAVVYAMLGKKREAALHYRKFITLQNRP